jgi:hypothetical protein
MRILIFFLLTPYVTFAQNYGCTDSNADNYDESASEIVFESPINTGVNMTVGGDGVLGDTNLLVDDFVGAFFINDNGDFVCAGNSSFNIEGVGIIMTIYGNDASTSVQDGFFQGQEMYFFIKRSDLDGEYIYPVSFSLLGEDPNEQESYISLPTTFNIDQVALFDLFFIGQNQVNCIYSSGCTDPNACNYNPTFIEEDGSCTYPNTLCESCQNGLIVSNNDIVITYTTSNYSGYGVSCDSNTDGFINIEISGGSGNYTYAWSNGSNDADISNLSVDNYILAITDINTGCVKYVDILIDSPGQCVIVGCADPTACNYDTTATDDDGSCYNNDLGCGCDVPASEEGYNCDGICLIDTDQDGVCDNFEIEGCIDLSACNYDTLFTDDDGSCNYVDGVCDTCVDGVIVNNDIDGDNICNTDEILGCTDLNGCNYDFLATDDDSTCVYVDDICDICSGAIDGSGLIIENDIDSDGVCNADEIEGCTDDTACNYDSNLTTDTNNNLCLFINGLCDTCLGDTDGTAVIVDNDIDNDGVCNDDEIEGCTDLLALNYNLLATDDDSSCNYCASLDLIDNSNYLKVNDVSFSNASGVTISFWAYDDNWALTDGTSEMFGTFIDFGSVDNFRYVIRWRDGVKGIQAYFEGDGFQNAQGVDCDGFNSDNCYTQNTTAATYVIPPYDFINDNNIYNWWEDNGCAWKNITAVFCSNSTRLYIDGQIVQQSMTNVYYPESIFSLDSLDNNIIGSNQLDGQFNEGQLPCDAQIDEVRIWSRALSDLEIQARIGDNVDINLNISSEQSNDVGKLEGYWKSSY